MRVTRMAVVTAMSLIAALAAPPALANGSTPRDLAASSHSHAPRHKFGRGESTNWSGYAVPGTGARNVIGTWTVPAVTCAKGENSWSSPWVGIDGYTSTTVEQIGTDSDCLNGSPVYYAWYEMYPKSLVQVDLPVRPGDSFTGRVWLDASGAFLLKLTNNTTGDVFRTTQNGKRTRRTSVEWIMEGPSNGLLSNFGAVPFTAAAARISNTPTTQSLGSFSNADKITMVDNQGHPRAVPSNVSGGTSFSVDWLSH